MLRIRKHRYFGLRRSAPEEVHNRTILGIYCLNDRISELLPASSLMGIRLVRAHSEDGVEQKHSLICPFFQITVIRNVTAQIIMQFLINVLQGRRDLLLLRQHGERKTMCLIYIVIGVLSQQEHFYLAKRRKMKGIKDILRRRVDHCSAVFLPHKCV